MAWKKNISMGVALVVVAILLIVIGIKCPTETRTQYPEICWGFLLAGVLLLIGVLVLILREIYTIFY
jgi:nitrogen fixation/metabolism regulation signal transduction histidine kinase